MSRVHSALVLASLCLLAFAPHARAAGGVNLSWNDCGAFGIAQQNFACNSNTAAAHVLFGTAVIGHDMPELNGQASVFEIVTNQPALSPWWHMESGGCRSGAVVASFDFTGNANCLDPWSGIPTTGGIHYTANYLSAERARIRTVCAIPGSTSINGTDEYAFVKVAIQNAKTTGNGSCGGCTDGACIVFNSFVATQPLGVGDYSFFEVPLQRAWVLWQPGGAGVIGGCPGATPVRARTWGSVKSLYR